MPAVVINDEPRFAYRGVMLDVSRHFLPTDFVKKYIDLLAMHNINRFHWHLTDDQGWRIEIKKYPKLTELGSQREETVIGKNTGEYDGKPHGGYYSQDEIKEIIDYAQERYITIIPEIDLPGHMLGALKGYPQYGCTGGPYEVATTWGIKDDVICAGNEESYQFLEDILTEVMDLFPSRLIHIGGDEVRKGRWEECTKCQARINKLGLKSDAKHSKEHYLQSYMITRISKFLNDHGRTIIGWDEILEGGLAPNATIMSWRGTAGGIEAAQLGHDVIMTPRLNMYFDYYQTSDTDDEPFSIGGYVPVDIVYHLEPIPEMLTNEESKHILGVQANVWTEYIATPEHAEYMSLPRMAALSEVQWTDSNKKDYNNFLERLPQLLQLYENENYNYTTHVYGVRATLEPNFQTNALDVEFTTMSNNAIYYTLDGSEPTTSSIKYEEKFNVNESTIIKAATFSNNGERTGPLYEEKIAVSKSSFKPIDLLTKPSPHYAHNGAPLLVDGLKGNDFYKTNRWIGFYNNHLVAVIDMLQPTEISEINFTTHVIPKDLIFDAEEVTVEASDNNEDFEVVFSEKNQKIKTDHKREMLNHHYEFDGIKSRYFKITIQPLRSIPQWHPAANQRAFLFIDEIELN